MQVIQQESSNDIETLEDFNIDNKYSSLKIVIFFPFELWKVLPITLSLFIM